MASTDSAKNGAAASDETTVEVEQRGSELIASVALPGLDPDDVIVEAGEDVIRISGERLEEHHNNEGPIYSYERSYGSFYREIPLPPGAMTDQTTASFKNGILEIRVPAPPDQVSRGRRIEISQ